MTALTRVVPTFDEVGNVETLVDQLNQSLDGLDTEVSFVDRSTGDTPRSGPIRGEHVESSGPPRAPADSHGGLAGAVVTGVIAASSPGVVVMDEELQPPRATVPFLYVHGIGTGADVVVASGYLTGDQLGGLSRQYCRLVSARIGRTARVLFVGRLAGCTDPMSGLLAVRLSAVEATGITQRGYELLLALLIHRQLEVEEVAFSFGPRGSGQSNAFLLKGMRYLRLLVSLRVTSRRWSAGHALDQLGLAPKRRPALPVVPGNQPGVEAADVVSQ